MNTSRMSYIMSSNHMSNGSLPPRPPSPADSASPRRQSKGRRWPAMIFALIGMNMCIVAITVIAATRDPSVATEPEYYSKAVHFDDTIRQRAENARLAWSATATIVGTTADGALRLHVALNDEKGAGISGAAVSAELFASVRSGDRQHLTLISTNAGEGVYEAAARIDRPGLWIVRIVAKRGTETYTRQTDLLIPGLAR